MTTATQFVFPHPYFDMVCNRLADFDYREQYKRLNELYLWLAHCVQEDIRVQISSCFIIWRMEMKELQWLLQNGWVVSSREGCPVRLRLFLICRCL